MPKCPECEAPVPVNARTCKACGLGEGEPPPYARVGPPRSDGATYGIIIGGLVAAVVVVLFLASFMGGQTCGECNGKKIVTCGSCTSGVAKCVMCKGSGSDPQTFSTCMTCQGKGSGGSCQKCGGDGKKICPSCDGKGSR